MLSREELVNKVLFHRGRSPAGVACEFIKIDEKWGIKKFYYKGTRDRAYKNQRHMASVGCGPKVGPKLDISDNIFCYVTEVAQPFIDGAENGCDDIVKRSRELRGLYDDPEFREWIKETCREMREHGFHMNDPHFGNFGILRDKVVCIDFGNEG